MESALLAPPYRPLGEVTKLGFLQLSKQITRGFRELAFRLLQSHNSVLLLLSRKPSIFQRKILGWTILHYSPFYLLPSEEEQGESSNNCLLLVAVEEKWFPSRVGKETNKQTKLLTFTLNKNQQLAPPGEYFPMPPPKNKGPSNGILRLFPILLVFLFKHTLHQV